jgi:hypothetical protein
MAADQNDAPKRRSLTEGGKLRCPSCEALGHPFRDFKPLEVPESYKRELNPVYCHVKHRGGCGHVFSPGEPWIIEAYLAGDLVHRQLLDQANELISSLREKLDGNQSDNAERRVAA